MNLCLSYSAHFVRILRTAGDLMIKLFDSIYFDVYFGVFSVTLRLIKKLVYY